jgi:putative ABC transport system substrate-binding protein
MNRILPILLLFGLCQAGAADEVVIVPSSDAAPYLKAKQALLERLALAGFSVRVDPLDNLRGELDPKFGADTRAVVAIGSKAAVWLRPRVKPPVRLTYCMVSNPLEAGLGEAPITPGISTDVPLERQFGLIREALPGVRSLGMLYASRTEEGRNLLEAVRAGLPEGWRLEAVPFDRHETVAEAIRELFSRNVDIVWTAPDSAIYNRATVHILLLTSLREKVPVFGFSPALVKAGCLLGVGIDVETQGRQAADLTRQLLRGRDDSEVRALQEVEYEIALNLIVAEQLSIDMPQALIKRANHVFRP